jgi:hypothetical protein
MIMVKASFKLSNDLNVTHELCNYHIFGVHNYNTLGSVLQSLGLLHTCTVCLSDWRSRPLCQARVLTHVQSSSPSTRLLCSQMSEASLVTRGMGVSSDVELYYVLVS